MNKERAKWFFSNHDSSFSRQYILKHHKESYESIRESVDLLLDNTFVFNGNWDMEPCHIPYRLSELCWDQAVTDDNEWNYMLNRQSYLLNFLIVHLVEDDYRYIGKLKEMMFHWIDCDFELKPESLTSRTLDTAIRCLVWLKVVLYLQRDRLIKSDELVKILGSVKKQLQFLQDHYIEKYSLSNWGVFQTVAILTWLYYFEDEFDMPELRAFAEDELEEQLRLQILEDGTQYEQSIMYHVEVYKALLDLAIFVPDYKNRLIAVLEKMAHYIVMMTGPDHHQIAFGDSDVTDTRDILTLSALVLKSGQLKTYGYCKVNIESLMYFGKIAVQHYQQIEAEPERAQISLFDCSGHICFKEPQRYLFFKCGPLGSAHSHSDQNSLCLYDRGVPIIIDPGRYTYREDSIRYWLKSSKSHSTCFIKDKNLEEITDSWSYAKYPTANHVSLTQQDDVFLMEGLYSTDICGKPFMHNRLILGLPNHVTLIVDEISHPGKHDLESQFILDKDVTINHHRVNQLYFHSAVPFNEDTCLISKRYNQLVDSKRLYKTISFEDNSQDYTLIADHNCRVTELPLIQTGSEKPLKNGLAWEIVDSDHHYLVGVMVSDILTGDKLYKIKGRKCRGKVVVFDIKNSRYYRLKS
ncbi:alginate lyase family protein [Streptococcus jiangjianxini]|uniref:alginate lyase family protein n=1 Tax=Streptococcus jiangjianxini TaxID=3161189 RepID=UPI0032EC7288